MNRTVIKDMTDQIKDELDLMLIQVGTNNDVALDHIARVVKQIDALRYQVWNSFHISGEVK